MNLFKKAERLIFFKMFLNYIFHFFKGYVILLAEGKNFGLFINICSKHKIRLYNIRTLGKDIYEIETDAADFKKMRHAAYKSHTKLHIKKKFYIKNIINKYKKRVFYAVGLLLFLAFTAVSSRFIWSIEVLGSNNNADILSAAELAGIKIGAYKPALPDGNEMKNIILTNTDGITWAWVYLKGTKAVIEVREAVLPPAVIDKNTPCDIVAAHDGVITDIIVKEGVALCKKGEPVLKGDILISGTYENADGEKRFEHALGEVYAATVRKTKKNVKLYKKTKKATGKKKSYTDLNIFSKHIPLYINADPKFDEYSIKCEKRELKWGRSHYLGIELITNTYYEEISETVPITSEDAASAIKDELCEAVAKELLPGSQLKGEKIDIKMLNSETAEVTLSMSFTEKIGVAAEITEEKQE